MAVGCLILRPSLASLFRLTFWNTCWTQAFWAVSHDRKKVEQKHRSCSFWVVNGAIWRRENNAFWTNCGHRKRLFTAVLPLSAPLCADERLWTKGKRANHVLTGMRVFSTSLIQTNANHKTSLNKRQVSSLLTQERDNWFGRDILVKPMMENT